jgi:hypothetical protein
MAGATSATYAAVNRSHSDVGGLHAAIWGEPRLVERRIVRGNPNVENPDFVEIGIAADGRVAQVLAFNHTGEDDLLGDLVRRRLNVTDIESQLRDPSIPLANLLQ